MAESLSGNLTVQIWILTWLLMKKIFHGNRTNAPGINLKIQMNTDVQLRIFQSANIFAVLNIWIICFAVTLMKIRIKEMNKSDGYYH